MANAYHLVCTYSFKIIFQFIQVIRKVKELIVIFLNGNIKQCDKSLLLLLAHCTNMQHGKLF